MNGPWRLPPRIRAIRTSWPGSSSRTARTWSPRGRTRSGRCGSPRSGPSAPSTSCSSCGATTRRWPGRSAGWRRRTGLAWNWLGEVHRERGELLQALEAARRAVEQPGGIFDGDVFADADAVAEGDALLEVEIREGRAWASPGVRRYWLSLRGRMREVFRILESERPGPGAEREAKMGYHGLLAQAHAGRQDLAEFDRQLHALFSVGKSDFACQAWALAVMGEVERALWLSARATTATCAPCAWGWSGRWCAGGEARPRRRSPSSARAIRSAPATTTAARSSRSSVATRRRSRPSGGTGRGAASTRRRA